MKTRSSGGPGFPVAELASPWGYGGCSCRQILEVARDFISCPTRAHPCTGTTAGAVWSVLVSAYQRIRALRRAFMEQIAQISP